jgi:hypothetical protein
MNPQILSDQYKARFSLDQVMCECMRLVLEYGSIDMINELNPLFAECELQGDVPVHVNK